MYRLRGFFVVALLCSLILWSTSSVQAQDPTPSTWGSIKAMYGVNDKTGAQSVGGVNRYDSFPSQWKFPFHNTSTITVFYGGGICRSSEKDSYHSGKDYYALDWSRDSGDRDIGDPIYAPASGWATAAFSNTGYGNRISVEAGNGYSYLIAHMDQIALNYYGWIERGQYLGTLGCSGSCWGAHIHFVVYKSGKSVPQDGIAGQWGLKLCSTYSSGQ